MAILAQEELMEAASASTGLTDFGSPEFEEPLSVLIKSFNEEAQLSEAGELAMRSDLVGNLMARLNVVEELKKAPEALDAEIERPIFILGFPRTGTTALHNLIQANPDCQVLEHWLAKSPRPRPPRDRWKTDSDFQKIAATLNQMYETNPDVRTQHYVSVDGAEECRLLFMQMFMDDTFGYLANLPSYREWLDGQSMEPVYRWHKNVLKLIQHPGDARRRWVLKYPSHLAWTEQLLEMYPDAYIIHTHRDPESAIPSFASLLSGHASLLSETWTPQDVGSFLAKQWRQRIDDYIDLREELGRENQFFDIRYQELVSDPSGAVRQAFEKFGLQLTDEAEAAMKDWQNNNPPGKHGKHSYTAEQFGLSSEVISKSFQRYRERFGLTGK